MSFRTDSEALTEICHRLAFLDESIEKQCNQWQLQVLEINRLIKHLGENNN